MGVVCQEASFGLKVGKLLRSLLDLGSSRRPTAFLPILLAHPYPETIPFRDTGWLQATIRATSFFLRIQRGKEGESVTLI